MLVASGGQKPSHALTSSLGCEATNLQWHNSWTATPQICSLLRSNETALCFFSFLKDFFNEISKFGSLWQLAQQAVPGQLPTSLTFQPLLGGQQSTTRPDGSPPSESPLPQGLHPVGCAWNTIRGVSGGILIRCLAHLNWLLLMPRCSSSAPNSPPYVWSTQSSSKIKPLPVYLFYALVGCYIIDCHWLVTM